MTPLATSLCRALKSPSDVQISLGLVVAFCSSGLYCATTKLAIGGMASCSQRLVNIMYTKEFITVCFNSSVKQFMVTTLTTISYIITTSCSMFLGFLGSELHFNILEIKFAKNISFCC